MKKVSALLLALAMTVSLVACGNNDKPAGSTPAGSTPATSTPAGSTPTDGDAYANLDAVVLRGGDSSGKGAAAQLLGEMIGAKLDTITGGKLTVEYYPNGEMGGDMDLQQAMLDGTLDYVVLQTAPTVSFVPAVAVFDLPMVFAKYDGDTIDAVLNSGTLNEAIAAEYEKADMHLMGFLQNATYRLTTSNIKLDNLDAFNGLRVRTMENKNHMAFWTALGAAPTPLAWGEVYISLQNGTIAAQENAADTCATSNFQEVQDYLNCTNHILYLNQAIMSKAKLDSLDPAYQAAIAQAVSESLAELRPALTALDQDNKKLLEDGGMEIVEYAPEFFDEILALDGVKTLYAEIDTQVSGLGTLLQEELAK